MSTKSTAKHSIINKRLLLSILLFAVTFLIFKGQDSTTFSSFFQHGQKADFIADQNATGFHFTDQVGSDYSDEYLFIEETEDDEIKEKSKFKVDLSTRDFHEIPLIKDLSVSQFAYLGEAVHAKPTIKMYVLHHSWKHFLA